MKQGRLIFRLLLTAAALFVGAPSLLTDAFSVNTSSAQARPNNRVVVVGKIIIDEYKNPTKDSSQEDALVSIGGGGPQAAWSAAAALAILSNDSDDDQDPPLPQPVTFVGPVGSLDWTKREESALEDILGPAIDSIHLVVPGENLKTPRIQLWYDDEQRVQWRALRDSFGPQGACTLWTRPSSRDFLSVLDDTCETPVTCHVIIEGGADSPGLGQDGLFLSDAAVQERIGYLGVEPVTFLSEETGRVSERDARACTERLEAMRAFLRVDFISPDMPLFRACAPDMWEGIETGVRNGPQGSILLDRNGEETSISAATLKTEDGEPVNPTGAGNSYAAAFTACRGSGASALQAACIASAIGAVFCEYNHVPPWSASVLRRIRQAASEVHDKLASTVER